MKKEMDSKVLSKEQQINARIASLKNELNSATGPDVKPSGSSVQNNVALVEQLQEDLARRQESYVRRERAYEEKLREMGDEIAHLTAGRKDWMEQDEKVRGIREMHKQLMSNVNSIKSNTAKVLEDQERDLLRAFRARLFDIQSELETEKSKADVGASAWIERNRQLERGLDWAKEMADRLERVNQNLQAENGKLKAQYKTQENDREFLIKQLVVVKKDNVQLRQEIETRDATIARVTEENEALALFKKQTLNRASAPAAQSSNTASPASGWSQGKGGLGLGNLPTLSSATMDASNIISPGAAAMAASQASDERYKEIIKRLKKLLDTERQNLRKVRAAYNADIKNRTELEVLLRKTVSDVRSSIIAARKRSAAAKGNNTISAGSSCLSNSRSQQSLAGGSGLHAASSLRTASSTTSLDQADASEAFDANDFDARDREKVLELLLSQERVVSMLYRKTFPTSKAVPTNFVIDSKADDMIQKDIQSANLAIDKPELEAIVTNRQNKK